VKKNVVKRVCVQFDFLSMKRQDEMIRVHDEDYMISSMLIVPSM